MCVDAGGAHLVAVRSGPVYMCGSAVWLCLALAVSARGYHANEVRGDVFSGSSETAGSDCWAKMALCLPANERDCRRGAAGHRLAIIGAGPVGVELALSALQRGMRVAVFERGASAGAQVLSWSHVKLFSPWSMNTSDSGRGVLEDAGLQAPVGEHCPTGGEFVTQYLQPLAEHIQKHSSCIAVHYNARVLAIGRGALLKGESIGGGDVEMPVGRPQAGRTRVLTPFRLLVSHDDCGERYHEGFDFVCDCSGSYRSLCYSCCCFRLHLM